MINEHAHMDRKRIIVGLVLGCILILSGCRREALPDGSSDAIRFSMGASLVSQEEPATKFGDLKGDFESGNSVLVFGRRNTDNHPVFDGVIVTLGSTGWTYETPRYWNWAASTDWYDFLAMYPVYGTIAPSCDFDADPLTLSVSYNASAMQYDLMLAGKRRTYSSDADRMGKVPLTFSHMLCAVQVKVKNGSTNDSFWLQGYHFENLVVTGVAAASYDALGNPTLGWDERSRLTTPVGGADVGAPGERHEIKTETTNNTYTFSGQDLMIPQNHSEKIGSNYPTLVVDYAVSATSPLLHARIQLKDVLTNTNAPAIPSWEMGTKYCYEVIFSLDGGVQVRVTTTNWDAVAAETPGILIPQL